MILEPRLGAIESLMSAVLSDRMSGDQHKPNVELIAQGVANIFSPMFGPASGAAKANTANSVMAWIMRTDELPETVVLRLRNMPAINAIGMQALQELADQLLKSGRNLLLCGARSIDDAMERAEELHLTRA